MWSCFVFRAFGGLKSGPKKHPKTGGVLVFLHCAAEMVDKSEKHCVFFVQFSGSVFGALLRARFGDLFLAHHCVL